MRIRNVAWGGLVTAALLSGGWAQAAGDSAAAVERGRYVVSTSGCNDCHTRGYPESGGKVPLEEWLRGNPVGFSGPWGTTYPANLRLVAQSLDEAQWLQAARREMRPPMPWFSLRDMSDEDLRAVYAFIRSLGEPGEAAPEYVPPGVAVNTPYIDFVPRNLPNRQAAR
ncbi:c-type cytochrome [Thioalbus denitrificans]|uniref:Cytochrome c n=1 Tax=Thioalbus denitrificans TaxID=547122 RepID=A0A369CBV8_9GAMM|nr:c-type cytochrome [Thioalbus denitrificans]RCX31183.1 cytochrome c [Thioalbus denitrificans]